MSEKVHCVTSIDGIFGPSADPRSLYTVPISGITPTYGTTNEILDGPEKAIDGEREYLDFRFTLKPKTVNNSGGIDERIHYPALKLEPPFRIIVNWFTRSDIPIRENKPTDISIPL